MSGSYRTERSIKSVKIDKKSGKKDTQWHKVEKVIKFCHVADILDFVFKKVEEHSSEFIYSSNIPNDQVRTQLVWDKGGKRNGGTTKLAIKFNHLPEANSVRKMLIVSSS